MKQHELTQHNINALMGMQVERTTQELRRSKRTALITATSILDYARISLTDYDIKVRLGDLQPLRDRCDAMGWVLYTHEREGDVLVQVMCLGLPVFDGIYQKSVSDHDYGRVCDGWKRFNTFRCI